jgi:hypothetical protein
MRRLWVAACWVSRSQARTRRSSAARAASGSCSGWSPAGSTSGRRARVSASMPLDLAWRDSSPPQVMGLAELTRYTVWPRAAKNTAIGSHAGPVGSTTTSSRVPAGVLASAARSTSPRLSTVGIALRRHTRLPSPASTRTVWALVVPRSIPTSRRSSILLPPWPWWPARRPLRRGGAGHATVPRALRPTTAPTHVLQPAATQLGRATSLIRGIRGRPRAATRRTRLDASAPSSEEDSTPPPGTSRDAHATLGPWRGSSTAVPYMRTAVRRGAAWPPAERPSNCLAVQAAVSRWQAAPPPSRHACRAPRVPPPTATRFAVPAAS